MLHWAYLVLDHEEINLNLDLNYTYNDVQDYLLTQFCILFCVTCIL